MKFTVVKDRRKRYNIFEGSKEESERQIIVAEDFIRLIEAYCIMKIEEEE